MDHLNVETVRLATSFVLAGSCLYPILRRAKMYEIQRVVSCDDRDTRCAPAFPPDKTHLAIRPRSLRPSTLARGHNRTYKSSNMQDESIERKSNLPNWDKLIASYYIFSSTFNVISGFKYLVLCLLDIGLLRQDKYGHLDCLLIGRPTINPRVTGLLKYASLCVYWFHNLYHFFMLARKLPFRLHCLEFLLMSPREIEDRLNKSDGGEYCTLLNYENPFVDCEDETGTDIGVKINHARPNRSLHAWRRLAKLMTVWVGALVGIYLIVVPLFYAAILPMIITRPGFEATYDVCLKWIAKQDRSSSSSSLWWREQVIDVPGNYTFNPRLRRKFYLTFSELWVEFSEYHKVRVLWDILENSLFIAQIYMALFVYMVPSMMISLDVSYYARQINAAIHLLISDYHGGTTSRRAKHSRHEHLDQSMSMYDDFLWTISADGPQSRLLFLQSPSTRHEPTLTRRQDYSKRIVQVQGMVVDLFSLIRDYNAYTFYYVSYCTFIWYTYSFICSSWLFMPSSRQESATIESYLIQATATTLVLVIMGAYSHAGRACCRLYQTISSVTSLQDIDLASRERWMVIMKHYKPVPLHCFSIFRTSELSWMFVIKLTAWLFSALFIVSSFLVGYGSVLHS